MPLWRSLSHRFDEFAVERHPGGLMVGGAVVETTLTESSSACPRVVASAIIACISCSNMPLSAQERSRS
ncbi:hypothetical protein ACTMTI_55625 [Nonomuraea sp. H19]|uniref:hypothetical protein n=1 Tax=Nonomuraea sp. H19 TaxID=3452206 RepID=UPI003F8C2703